MILLLKVQDLVSDQNNQMNMDLEAKELYFLVMIDRIFLYD